MRFMDSISPGLSLAIGAVTGLPSVAVAVSQGDYGSLVLGTAIGLVTLGWSIYRASGDQRLDALLKRLDQSEREVDLYRERATHAEAEAVRLEVKMARMAAQKEPLDAPKG
jgi:hypothetical protein